MKRHILVEHLTKAEHSASFAKCDLQHAMREADPVQSLVLLSLIGKAAELELQTKTLINAITANKEIPDGTTTQTGR